jgi:hypothetical protein
MTLVVYILTVWLYIISHAAHQMDEFAVKTLQ